MLFFDEIDALQGASLISVLRQLRAGHSVRPHGFPSSVVLCGVRDVRDCKVAAGGDPGRLGSASPFNIKLESLRLGDFARSEVAELYGQHTADTGQVFTPEAVDCAFELTTGQPWLVNALAREAVEKLRIPVEQAVTPADVRLAADRLIKARATHLDSLVDKLRQPEVARVLAPVIAGDGELPAPDLTYDDDDVSRLRDLGLVAADAPLRLANPIYREVVLRVLAGQRPARPRSA